MNIDDNGFINLSNGLAECKISLWGANIVSYRPKNEEHDIFWLGELNKFDNVQAIRGGVPICWPRFAEEKLNDRLPRHGFARISGWNLKKASVDENKIEAQLSLLPDAKYDVNATADLFIKITDKLEYRLETTNDGDQPFEFSEALHAYFNVSSVDNVKIKGLADHDCQNSLDGNTYTLKGDLTVRGEFDSVFTNHKGTVEIEDRAFNRVISIEKATQTQRSSGTRTKTWLK